MWPSSWPRAACAYWPIDFDLEAPGLERYFSSPLSSVHGTRGVIDLIDGFKRSLAGTGRIDDSAEFRQLDQYICPIASFAGQGKLDLMPAGKRLSEDDRRANALAVRTFDWQDFLFQLRRRGLLRVAAPRARRRRRARCIGPL